MVENRVRRKGSYAVAWKYGFSAAVSCSAAKLFCILLKSAGVANRLRVVHIAAPSNAGSRGRNTTAAFNDALR